MKSIAVIALLGLAAAQDEAAAAESAATGEPVSCEWFYYDEKTEDWGSVYGYED